jgi:hypothetical protein
MIGACSAFVSYLINTARLVCSRKERGTEVLHPLMVIVSAPSVASE